MAKELIFKIADKEFATAPVKLERRKIYGWTETVATDRGGETCVSAYLSPDDVLIIPAGGIQQAKISDDGRWLGKDELTAYSEDGTEVLPILSSSFDMPIELNEKATPDEFLDNDWESVYQLVCDELAALVGNDIYKFEFSYRGGTNHNDGYLVSAPAGLFLFAGDRQEFVPAGLAEDAVIDEAEDDADEELDELDFSML